MKIIRPKNYYSKNDGNTTIILFRKGCRNMFIMDLWTFWQELYGNYTLNIVPNSVRNHHTKLKTTNLTSPNS